MEEDFLEPIYDEIAPHNMNSHNVIKANDIQVKGSTKITVKEDSENGVTIFIKKDNNENISEIKFVCSCGQTKSLLLDYSGQE